MKLARALNRNNQVLLGIVEDFFYPFKSELNLICEIKNKALSSLITGEKLALSEIKLLPPCLPSKIVAVGLNYKSHAKEMNMALPDEPLIFLKPPSAVIGNGDEIKLPKNFKRVDYEAELAVVIGKIAKNISIDEAKDYILGYTCLNDVTERVLQAKDGQYARAKGFDTFAPVGPCIETELNPFNLDVKAFLNGKLVQKGNSSDMIFNVYQLVSFISNVMTLNEGDIISTGTPSGIGMLNDGDTIEIEVEGVGRLKNTVKI